MKTFALCAKGLLVLALTFAATTVNPAIAQGQSNPPGSATDISTQVEAFLGAHEDAVGPAQWRSLGDAAIPVLESIAADQSALPTRRARSVDGLAALVTGEATMRGLANSSGEALIVRMSAVRGLGQVLPESPLIDALTPLLQDPQPQLRGVAAETLSQTPSGCTQVKAMWNLETDAWRSRFARRCGDPTSSATQPATGASKIFGDPTARIVVYDGVDPFGTTIFKYANSSIAKILPSLEPGSFSVLLPNSPTVPFASGPWTFNLLASKPTNADVQALIKTASNLPLKTGTLNANLFFVGVPGLDAKTAPSDPNFQAILSKMQRIYAQVGIQLGALTYIDIKGPDATTFSDLNDVDLGALMQLSDARQAHDGAINIFFVHSILGAGLPGFIILGESAGIPGVPVRGTSESGLAVTMADFPNNFPNGMDSIAQTIAHETGHWLGLFHTTEAQGTTFDPLPDTPECPRVPYDTDHDGIMLPQECINLDATNLMFWTSPSPPFPSPVLTHDQQFVMLRNPSVSGQSGTQVSSIALGSFAVGTSQVSSPITLNVPANAVSFDLVGVVPGLVGVTPPPPPPPPPATIRVPQDLASVQLAVNNANPGDTIRVGPGRWCGARITKTLNLIGDGATIIGCPPGNPGPSGNAFRIGLRIDTVASGTSIRNFVFDGTGYSDTNRVPLGLGIFTGSGTNDLVIDSNTFLGGIFGVTVNSGKNVQVTHNVFDGFTILSDGTGGAAILDQGVNAANAILYNQITSTVPPGNLSAVSWINEVDVPFAGIVVSGEDGTTIANNKISIAANAHGDAGVGILATDSLFGFTTSDLGIASNDGRGSAFGLIITNDLGGGTANSVGAAIRGNFGVNLINGSTANVTNRSIQTSLLCDPTTGVCP
jgi:hypothetical protein